MAAAGEDDGQARDEVEANRQAAAGLRLMWQRHPRGAISVAVSGRVDEAAAPLLSRYLHRCLDRAQTVLVLDLTAVDFLDSTGLWTLYQVLERAPNINMVVRLVGEVPPVRRALDGAGMTGPAFRVYRTLSAALGLTGVAPMPRTAPRDDPTPV